MVQFPCTSHAVFPSVNLFPIATLVRVHLSQLMNQFVVFSRSVVSLCEPMDSSMPGFPVLRHLPQFVQTQVPWVTMPWNHLISVIPFSSCPQSFPASGSSNQYLNSVTEGQETWVRFLGWEDPMEKRKATHSSILAWRIPGTTHGVAKSQTQLNDFYFTSLKAKLYP